MTLVVLWLSVLALALALALAVAARSYKREADAILKQVQRSNAVLEEAFTLFQYGARDEAVDVLMRYRMGEMHDDNPHQTPVRRRH